MQRLDAPQREARVVHLRRLPRRPRLGVLGRVAGRLERRDRDLVDPDVIGVRVELPVISVGDDHLWPCGTDDRHEPADRLVERRVREVVGPRVRLGIRHARVVIAEPPQLVVADRRDARLELLHAHLGEPRPDVGRVDRLVQDVAGLTAGAADEHAPDALVVVAGDRRRALRRLVVRVRVDGQEREPLTVTIRGGHRTRSYRLADGSPRPVDKVGPCSVTRPRTAARSAPSPRCSPSGCPRRRPPPRRRRRRDALDLEGLWQRVPVRHPVGPGRLEPAERAAGRARGEPAPGVAAERADRIARGELRRPGRPGSRVAAPGRRGQPARRGPRPLRPRELRPAGPGRRVPSPA